jgi:hypothetical protein
MDLSATNRFRKQRYQWISEDVVALSLGPCIGVVGEIIRARPQKEFTHRNRRRLISFGSLPDSKDWLDAL